MTSRRWKKLALVLAFWTLPALVFTTQNFAAHLQTEHPLGWLRLLRWELTNWYAWAALYPLIAWLARRWPLGGDERRLTIAVHLAAIPLVTLAHSTLHVVSIWLAGWNAQPWSSPGDAIVDDLRSDFGASLLVYAAIVAATYAIDGVRSSRAREVVGLQVQARLAAAELETLRTQLRPHFLFNALHSISALMARDVDAARTMITRLGDLLRLSLETDGGHEVPLRQELEFLELYLDIQRMRYGDRLAVELAVEPDVLHAWVPKLLLQPLVENAIHHGIALRQTPGRIEIRAERAGGRVRLVVVDDGPGLERGTITPHRERIGVGNTRARLQHIYGDAHRFDMSNGPTGGCAVRIELPFHTAPRLRRGPAAA